MLLQKNDSIIVASLEVSDFLLVGFVDLGQIAFSIFKFPLHSSRVIVDET